MSYAIFRVKPINKLKDLGHIGAHNLRKKEVYKSNPDIDKSKSIKNIDIVPIKKHDYHSSFMELVKNYNYQYDEKQKTERENRRKSFSQMLDDSNSVVADELLFTSDKEFFESMNKEDIIDWANVCMEFIYNDIGYSKDQILNATIHLDEKTPHLHVVVVPLIKKFDKRSNKEKWTISKNIYMKDKFYLSTLQDKYHQKMINKGYNLHRGIKNSDNEHIAIKDYKRLTKKLNYEFDKKNNDLTNAIEYFEENSKTNKETIINKDYIKIKKDTFDSMNKVIKESKKIINLKPKMECLANEVDNYTSKYKSIHNENKNIKIEMINLEYENNKFKNKLNTLEERFNNLVDLIIILFKRLLHIGTNKDKDFVIYKTKSLYDDETFVKSDVEEIAKRTTCENELLKHIDKENQYDKDIGI